MANYTLDIDLELYQADILKRKIPSLLNQHTEGTDITNRDIATKWYAGLKDKFDVTAAFDPAKILQTSQVKRLAIYKTLELTYLYLGKGSKDASFEIKMEEYRDRYNDEFASIMSSGLSYDWDGSGDIGQMESQVKRSHRRITRY
jgi:hypothetical protein